MVYSSTCAIFKIYTSLGWGQTAPNRNKIIIIKPINSLFRQHELTGVPRHPSSGRGLSVDRDTDNETDEMTSMLQSNFDVSASMAGDLPYNTGGEDGRYSSVNRGRPVIIASNPHREGLCV